MKFRLELATQARKQLDKLQSEDRARLIAALHQMCSDPYTGDIQRLFSGSRGIASRGAAVSEIIASSTTSIRKSGLS